MDCIEIIKENLKAINEDYDSLKPFMKKHLQTIENAIQERYQKQNTAVNTLKSIDYSLKSIAEEIGASRTTLYNHEQLLKRYIEQSTEAVDTTNPLTQIDKVQKEKSLLQDQITKMMERDVDIELLRMQNRELSTSLEGKNNEIERLQARISELSEENRKLKADVSSQATKAFRKK